MSRELIVQAYICGVIAWMFVETQLTIQRIGNNPKHLVARGMKKLRTWAEKQPDYLCPMIKATGGLVLALAAFVPVLVSAVSWPVSIPTYILSSINWGKLRGRK
ncbi:hypothetical protein VPZ60_004225 [Salmonella enterica]|nr:hypothetical protein [Salmonella enterica]